MDYALEVEGLRKVYPKFELSNFNLHIPKGSIMGLIGENGAGKSTALKAILNLIKRDSGRVSFYGKEFSENNNEWKEDIGVVFDTMTFQEQITAHKLGKVAEQAYTRWESDMFEGYLSRFSIDPKKKMKEMSRGMQVKLCLAMALSHKPKLLILDEATSGLDPVIRDEILDIFLEFVQDEEHSVLISSHITSDLEKIADYITFIHKGNVLMSREKDEMMYQYGIIRCKDAFFQQMDQTDILACRKEGYQWDVLVKDRQKAALKYKDAVLDTPSLEEIMLIYIKGEQI